MKKLFEKGKRKLIKKIDLKKSINKIYVRQKLCEKNI
jgi:hypothetical protein